MSTRTRWMLFAAVLAILSISLAIALRSPAPPPNEVAVIQTPAPVVSESRSQPTPSEPVSPPPDPVAPAAPSLESPPVEQFLPFAVGNPANSISGVVTDRSGKPVAGAHVALVDDSRADITGQEGRYSIPFPRVREKTNSLIASHEGYSDSSAIQATVGETNVNLLLQPLSTISGRVVSARDGHPITEFQILPEKVKTPGDFTETKPEKIRNDLGQFKLSKVKAGTTGLIVSAKGFAETAIPIPVVVAGETREDVELRLETGAVLEGRVVDPSGQGLKLVQLYTSKPRRGAISSADGKFRFDSLPTGQIEITAKHEKFAPTSVNVSLARGIVNQTRIVMSEGVVIEGEFTVGGKPANGEVVLLPDIKPPATIEEAVSRGEPAFRMKAFAKDDGKYRFVGVPEAEIRLTGLIELSGCRTTWSKEIVVSTAKNGSQVVDFNFPPASAHVTGSIYTGPRQRLLGGATFIATYLDFTINGPTTILVRGDTDVGYYSLCLPSGTAGIFFSDNSGEERDGPRDKSFVLELKDGDRIEHDILLYGGATLRVSAKIPAPSSSNTAQVLKGEVPITSDFRFLNPELTIDGRSLDRSGHTTFWGLESGTYTVVAYVYSQDGTPFILGSAVVSVKEGEDVAVPLEAPKE